MTRRILRPRSLWLIPGLVVALYANGQAEAHGLGLIPLLAFGIVPHLPVVIGFGRLDPRAVPLHNAMHHPVPPMVVLGLAMAGILPPLLLVGALAWLSHIAIDWALGDGLRSADGSVVGRSARDPRAFVAATLIPRRASSGKPA